MYAGMLWTALEAGELHSRSPAFSSVFCSWICFLSQVQLWPASCKHLLLLSAVLSNPINSGLDELIDGGCPLSMIFVLKSLLKLKAKGIIF